MSSSVLPGPPLEFRTGAGALAASGRPPGARFRPRHQLPGDFLRALSAGAAGAGRGLEYRIAERRLHSDSPEVVLTYIFRPAESEFPPFFDQTLIARLAAEFCIPLTESTSRAEALARLAEEAFRQARLIDSQQDSPPRFEDFSLIGVRG